MITEEWLKSVEASLGDVAYIDHERIRDLIAEVRRLLGELDEQTDAATLAIDVAVARRKAAKAWKRSAKRHRLVLETRWVESCVAMKTDAITSERDALRAELDRVNARHMADADALLKERERADNLYRLSREGGFRPRWIAESEVAK